ncbi:MAG: MFS transporter [Ruminococcus flavefaciens]|nr:MFS transporter [Ruminococcus flavefaciens]
MENSLLPYHDNGCRCFWQDWEIDRQELFYRAWKGACMEQKNYRVLLSQKQYMKLLSANLVSRFGDSLDVIAYSWVVYEITGNESLMALILGLNYIPTVLLQPFAGVIVDRMKKKRIMVITDVLRFAIVSVFVVLYTKGALTSSLIAVLTLCTSTVEALRMPAGNAFMPMILSPEYYTVGKAANYSLSQACQLAGFVSAGGLAAWTGLAGALWIDAATFAISAAVIAAIKVPETCGKGRIEIRHIFTDFKDGISFLRENRVVQTISVIGLAVNFGLMPLSLFQTPYVNDYLKMGPEMLSYIKILMIAGMMAGAAVAPKLLKRTKAGPCFFAGTGMGTAIVCMYVTVRLENTAAVLMLLTLSMFCVGAGGGVLNVINGSCMMRAVPKDMMGRMSGLNAAIMEASMPVGSFLCSVLVLGLNVAQLYLLFGICTIAFYLYLGLAHKLDYLDEQGWTVR